jgi:acetoin utilization deacetylase AcuC-like enzyme
MLNAQAQPLAAIVQLFYTDHFTLPLPDRHRFPMSKYRLLRERIVAEGIAAEDDMHVPPAASDQQLLLVHDADYLRRVIDGQLTPQQVRRIGFPWSAELVERSRRSTGATIAAARAALAAGVGINLAGGTHHASRDCGEGYCVFNDAACAARVLQSEGLIRRAVIIDCDVHQGNGTASIFSNDPTVFTFSIHGDRNFPLRKFPSDLDIALPDGTGDQQYLAALAGGLAQSLDRARADFAFYLAGADPFAGDRLGRLNLTKPGLAQRDRMVLSACRAAGLPVAVAMAGGYAHDIQDIVDIHTGTIRVAGELFS